MSLPQNGASHFCVYNKIRHGGWPRPQGHAMEGAVCVRSAARRSDEVSRSETSMIKSAKDGGFYHGTVT
jgi:hypothetical protein